MRKLLVTGITLLIALLVVTGGSAAPGNESVGEKLSRVLQGLVSDGTLTQEQAAAVKERTEPILREARKEGRQQGHWDARNRHLIGGWGKLAKGLDLKPRELREQLASGKTLVEVAKTQGLTEKQLHDRLLTRVKTRLDEAVAEKGITRAQADERLEQASERVTRIINRDLSKMPGLRKGPGRGKDAQDD